MTLDKNTLRASALELREESKAQLAQMVRHHVERYENSTYEELARELGMTHQTLITYLKLAGYSRPRGKGSAAYKDGHNG
jgi:DNA-directed RNA polymerase specialized sigma54-like protein